MNDCLILIDLQNDYFPDGKMELENIGEASKNAAMLLKEFRNNNLPIIHIQHMETEIDAPFFLKGSYGSKIHNSVIPQPDEKIFIKNYADSFRETTLLEYLQKKDLRNLTICGAMTNVCINATSRAALKFAFKIVIAEDACAAKDTIIKEKLTGAKDVHSFYMEGLSGAGAKVIATQDIINKIRNE